MVQPKLLLQTLALIALGSVQVGCASGTSSTPSPSDAQRSSATDAKGDQLGDSPSYRDVVKTEVIKKGHSFVFRAELAGAVPQEPRLPPSVVELVWEWAIQTDDRFPTGFPNTPSMPHWPELQAQLVWNGSEFKARFIDRRPSLRSGEVIVKTIPFTIKGAQLELTADARSIEIPNAFGWIMIVNDWLVPGGQVTSNSQVRAIDMIPDQPPPTGRLRGSPNLVKF